MQTEDKQILSLCKDEQSKDRGFAMLVDRYKEQIYWHIRRIVVVHENAEDVFQETMVNVYRSITNFRGDSSLYTWIYRIATNESMRFIKRNKIFASTSQVDTLHESLKAGESIDAESMMERFEKAILSLPLKQQIVFNLRYYDQASYAQIAEITGSSVETLKTNYHYGAKKIKELMLKEQI